MICMTNKLYRHINILYFNNAKSEILNIAFERASYVIRLLIATDAGGCFIVIGFYNKGHKLNVISSCTIIFS